MEPLQKIPSKIVFELPKYAFLKETLQSPKLEFAKLDTNPPKYAPSNDMEVTSLLVKGLLLLKSTLEKFIELIK